MKEHFLTAKVQITPLLDSIIIQNIIFLHLETRKTISSKRDDPY
jgi:hypothetical protein